MKKLLSVMLFLLLAGTVAAQNSIQIDNQSVIPGQVFTVQVKVTNADAFVALQMDLTLPGALTLVDSSFQLNPARSNGQSIQASVLYDSILRILCYSADNKPFTGHSGWLFSFQLKAGTLPGNYALTPKNVTLGNAAGDNILTGTTPGTILIKAPNIQISRDSIDFGRTAVSQHTTRSFVLQNTGTEVLDISKIIISDTQFTANVRAPFSIAAGQSVTVTLTFAPNWKGYFRFPVTIQSNDPDEGVAKVNISAKAYTINEIHVGSMTAFSGHEADLLIAVNNMEPFSGIQFDLNLPKPLQYMDNSAVFTGRNTDQQISAKLLDAHHLRVVAFSSDNSGFTGTNGNLIKLSFHVNGTGGNYSIGIENSTIAGLDGKNILSATYGGSLRVNAPDISCPTNLDFGQVSSLDKKILKFPVNNNGSDTLFVNHVTFSDTAFSSDTHFPLVVLVGQSDTISIRFADTLKGNYTGTMRIFSNDPDENPFNVALSATSFIPNYLYIPHQQFLISKPVWVNVNVKNHQKFVGVQFDLNYPSDVFSCEIDSAKLTSRLSADQLNITENQAGHLKVLIYSMNQTTASGKDGSILKLKFKLIKDTTGTFAFNLSHAIIGNENSQNILHNSQSGTITLLPNAPGIPLALKATSIDQVSFTANWQAPASGFSPTGYYLEVATDSLFNDKVTGFEHLDVGNVLTKKVTGLSPQTKYFYRIQGYDAGGNSSYSNVISLKTLSNVITFTVSRDSLTLPADSGSQVTFQISANVTWTITTDSSWLSVSPTGGNDSAIITVTTRSPNNTDHDRIANLFIVDTFGDSLIVVVDQGFATAVREFGFSKSIKITPNPAANTVTISLKGISRRINDLMLVNIFGKVVYRLHGKQLNTDILKIDVSTLPDGIYLLGLYVGKNVIVRKIVVNHSFWH